MDSQKSKPLVANRRTQPRPDTDSPKNVQILRSTLGLGDELSIADDADFGGDPYNSTGQHVVLKSKMIAGD
jgi:hypothetical protein